LRVNKYFDFAAHVIRRTTENNAPAIFQLRGAPRDWCPLSSSASVDWILMCVGFPALK
jgi:hypothetical protein